MGEGEKSGEQFLNEKYPDLQGSEEVKGAVRNQELQEKELGNNPKEKIGAYLDRLEKLVLDPDKQNDQSPMVDKDKTKRLRALSLLRQMVMNKYIRPYKEKLSQGAALVEERAARQLGIEAGYGQEQLDQRGEIAVEDLEGSLDQWISYLSDSNESYPTWFRYYVFRNILQLGDYDKDKKEFPKRSAGTVRLFPEIDRSALAHIQNIIECSQNHKTLEEFRGVQKETDTPEDQMLTKKSAKDFAKLSFGKQYAESIQESGEINPELYAITEGTWIKYDQNNHEHLVKLWKSLQNKGTAWCTRGFRTAQMQNEIGDFYVYYTLDVQGSHTIPRIAIRMQDNEIFEVRGVADSAQNLQNNMREIAKEKYDALPGGEKYEKKDSDMKQLTEIERRFIKNSKLKPRYNRGHSTEEHNQRIEKLISEYEEIKLKNQAIELTNEELRFLYEIDNEIDGFGYTKDPRIEEIKKQRDQKKDIAVIFDCYPRQVALSDDEITDDKIVAFNMNFHHHWVDIKNLKIIVGNFGEAPTNQAGTYGRSEYAQVKSLNKVDTITGDAWFGKHEGGLGVLKNIGGDANFRDSDIEFLGRLEKIGGNARFNDSKLRNLGALRVIGGNAWFSNSDIENLGYLNIIKGFADFGDSKVKNLGQLKEIRGNVYVNKDSTLDFSNVKIGGKIIKE